MPFVEIAETRPPKGPSGDRVRCVRMKSGVFRISVSEALGVRLGFAKGATCRVLVDLESSPRVVRLLLDPQGPHRIGAFRKGGFFACFPINALPKAAMPAEACAFDEDEDGEGRRMLDVELPAACQATPPALAQLAPPIRPVNAAHARAIVDKDIIAEARRAVPAPANGAGRQRSAP